MTFRIYVDESGTHAESDWLIIGMLFVPDHGQLHSDLCAAKQTRSYFNNSKKRKARYKETHFTKFRTRRDLAVAEDWIEVFAKRTCFYRCIVIDWSIWDGSYFGSPFEPVALKKRRAYKKWAELLLNNEVNNKTAGRIRKASLYLDRLRLMYGYDIIPHLEDRFTHDGDPRRSVLSSCSHVPSWKDAHQCLQLCDLLTGCMHQVLKPAESNIKESAKEALAKALSPLGVSRLSPSFWKQYHPSTLAQHCPKYSAWFWNPTREGRGRRKKHRRRFGL